jgi:hypothetical protein
VGFDSYGGVAYQEKGGESPQGLVQGRPEGGDGEAGLLQIWAEG